MEEDIKKIEDVLKDKDTKFWIGTQGIQAIQNLIARYEELEKENNLLQQLNEGKVIELIFDNYIPKSKVKEKIEELYEEEWDFNEVRDEIIEILQELLED